MPIRIGQYFGALKVISGPCSTGHGRLWLCRCSCGKLRRAYTGELNSGSVRSCGHHRGRKEHHGSSASRRAADANWRRMIGHWGHDVYTSEAPNQWGLTLDDYVVGDHAEDSFRVVAPPVTDDDWRASVAERGAL